MEDKTVPYFHYKNHLNNLINTLAGIYIHIPFCKQACFYCDFHFSTNRTKQHAIVEAIATELVLRRKYLGAQVVRSVYFGGGTPSLLTKVQLEALLKAIYSNFEVSADVEITLEANPDDLNPILLQEFREVGINRLSIGLQSFHQPHLAFMNRAHNSQQAVSCLSDAQAAGFENISIDLIYGIPIVQEDSSLLYDHQLWRQDLAIAMEVRPKHIAAYCLTIEDNTVFGRWQKQGKLPAIDNEFTAQQFEILLSTLNDSGYEQYEISNFCLPNSYSRHNSNYWKGIHYLGVGPSAHSFNGISRQYNLSNNPGYLRAIDAGGIPFEQEKLSREDQINDYLLTTLRTIWGTSIERLDTQWGFNLERERKKILQKHLSAKNIIIKDRHLYLTTAGKLLADTITTDLMC